MHLQRPTFHTIASALLLGSSQAFGLGFGPAPAGSTLGQPLDFVVPLRLDAGESAAPECVSAEVAIGDQRLTPGTVRARIESGVNGAAVRVQTQGSVDEPVVVVTIAVGCPARLQRRFTLFADPPSGPSVLPPSAVVELAAAPAPVAVDARPAPTEARVALPVPAPMTLTMPPAPRVPKTPPRAAARRAAPPAAGVAAAPRARLKLDAVEPPAPVASAPVPLAAELIEAAASAAAAKAAAAATSAAAERIAALEKSIATLRADSAADRDALRQLRARAAEGDSAAGWLPYLAAMVAALAGLSAWQWLKLRRLMRERQQAWWNAAAAAPEAEEPAAASTPSSAPTPLAPLSAGTYPTTRPGALGTVFTPEPAADASGEPPVSATERTQPLPVGWREENEAPRDVSIEELIDLEQQAEFFLVLGQEDAAIDLLVDHLRSTGGGSPMPYLKLLEIYRRRGDRESYDRMRARFNHRFNAYAPDWDTDPHQGRSLEDYPSIVARLQMAWPSPLDAMAELEALLFRKTKGELFDMPAYRDVLFLYSLARDLLDREPVDSGNVDVLLPISDGETYTQPMSLEQIYDGVDSGSIPLDNAPTVPVDLDVTQPVIPDSLFNDPTEPGFGGNGRRRH